MTNEQITEDFIKQINSGVVHPNHMADVLYSMHAAIMDRFQSVALWMPADLESVADDLVKAVNAEADDGVTA